MISTESSPERPKRHRFWLLVAVGATLVAIPAGVWFGRFAIGQMAVARYCSERDLTCALEFDRLDFDGVSVRNVTISKPGVDPVKLDRLELGLDWPQLFSPLPTSVAVHRPQLVVDARGGNLSVPIFEAFETDGGDDGDIELPPFVITDGQLTVLTDAGPIVGVVNTSGTLNREIQSSLVLKPADLKLDEHSLSLKSAKADLVLTGERITGNFTLDLETAYFDEVDARNILLEASLNPIDAETYEIDWSARADWLDHHSLTISNFSTDGLAQIRFEGEPSLETASVLFGSASVEADRLRIADAEQANVELTLDLKADGAGLAGPLSLSTREFRSAELAEGEAFLLTGDVRLDDQGIKPPRGQFKGALTVSGVALEPDMISLVTDILNLPEPLDLHAAAARSSLETLLTGVDSGMSFQVDFDAAASGLQLTSDRPFSIQSVERDIVFSIQPDREFWLKVDNQSVDASGRIAFSDNSSGLAISAAEFQLNSDLSTGEIDVRFNDIALQDWEIGPRSLAIDLNALRVSSKADTLQFSADGQARFSGDAFGTELDKLTLIGDLAGLDTGSGMNVRLTEGDCFSYGLGTATLDDIVIGPVQGKLCADGGRLFERLSGRGDDILVGALTSEQLALPISMPDVETRLSYMSPKLDWRLDEKFTLRFASPVTRAHIVIASDNGEPTDIILNAKHFGAVMATSETPGEPSAVDIDVGDAEIEIANLPAGISLSEWSASGVLGDEGPVLDWTLLGLQVFDNENPADNALYQPIMTSGSGHLTTHEVTYSGRLRLAETEGDFGEIVLFHNIGTGAGEVSLRDGRLRFSRNGLQFYDVSERLRGLAVKASGEIRPEANVAWLDGELSGSAKIDIDGITFSTFRLGQFTNLTGTLNISDIINLRTPPKQSFTLEALEITPEIVLRDGKFEVQLINPDLIHLEKISWPFVGGQLYIEPAWWSFDADRQKLTVRADEWELEQLIGLFSVPDLEIRGTVSGGFPIEIIGPDIYLRNASLSAVDGGVFRYKGSAGSQASSTNEYTKMAFDALENFEYKVLALGANGNLLDEILLELNLSGRNPDVLDGQEFIFNITLQSELLELIRGGSYAASADATREAAYQLILDSRKSSSTETDD